MPDDLKICRIQSKLSRLSMPPGSAGLIPGEREKIWSSIPNSSAKNYAIFQCLSERKVIIQGLAHLERNLPGYLCYHSADHAYEALKDVLLLAVSDMLPQYDTELLAIAAVYHDMGFTAVPSGNKEASVEIAERFMIKNGYTPHDCAVVEALIRSTDDSLSCSERPLICGTSDKELSAYIRDADLSYLGGEKLLEKAALLEQERSGRETSSFTVFELQEFLSDLLETLTTHTWQSKAGADRFQKQTEANINKVAVSLNASNLLVRSLTG